MTFEQGSQDTEADPIRLSEGIRRYMVLVRDPLALAASQARGAQRAVVTLGRDVASERDGVAAELSDLADYAAEVQDPATDQALSELLRTDLQFEVDRHNLPPIG